MTPFTRVAALIGAVAAAGLASAALVALRHETALIGVLAAGGLGAGLFSAARSSWLLRGSSVRFVLVCLAAFVATRGLVIRAIPTEPVSDFRSYQRLAEAMAQLDDLNRVYGFLSWGYPLLLAPFYALFGPTTLVAQVLNLLAGAASIPLLHRLGRWGGGETTARLLVLLFLCWPAQWMLAPVLASEHFALLGTLAALNLVLIPSRRDRYRRFIVGGMITALTATVRPVLGILLPMLVLSLAAAGDRRKMLVGGALLAAAYVGTQSAWNWTVQTLFQRRPPSVMWWNLLAGSNYEARGQWNAADAALYKAAGDQAARDAFAREEIRRRVTQRGLLEHLDHARRKIKLLWADGTYGVYWATHTMRPGRRAERIEAGAAALRAASQACHAMLLGLAALGFWRVAAGRIPHWATPLLLLIAMGTAAHVIFESQPRYAYVFTLGVLFSAAWALRTSTNASRAVRESATDESTG